MEMHTQMALEQMIEALELVTIQDDTLVELLRCTCIVLQLGNCTFELQQQEGGDADKNHECTVVANSNGSLEALARLWGIMDDDDSDSATTMLTKALTQCTIAAGTELVMVPLTMAQAQDVCGAKKVYARTFPWLVQRINGTTAVPANAMTTAGSSPFRTIGVLDVKPAPISMPVPWDIYKCHTMRIRITLPLLSSNGTVVHRTDNDWCKNVRMPPRLQQ